MNAEASGKNGSGQHSSSAVRLAYLLSQYPARSHTFFLHEVLGLRERGCEIHVASINAPDRPLSELPASEAAEAQETFYIKRGQLLRKVLQIFGIAFTRPAVVARGFRTIMRLQNVSLRERLFWVLYLAEALLVGRWMQRENLQHLHVHFGGAVASVGLLTSVAWQVPYSLTIHGPEELLNPLGYQLPAKLVQASFVICISEFSRRTLASFLPADQHAKLHIVRLGVNLSQLSSPAFLPQTGAPIRLVCVGRLVPEKGHAVLIEALGMLKRRSVPMHATFVGAGVEEEALRAAVFAGGLQDDVVFTSGLSHQQALAHVRDADVFALASFAEGVPVALMEAMALGVPCVSTRIAGIPELIVDGESGLLVPPGDASALAEALATLAADAAFRRRLSIAGRTQIEQKYDLARNLDSLKTCFQELASASPSNAFLDGFAGVSGATAKENR